MLDIDKIRTLVEMMVDNDLVEISLRDGEEEINLRRPQPGGGFVAAPLPAQANPFPQPAANPESAASPLASKADSVELVPITSPMVGTFYSSPDPESPPFVQLGQTIHSGMVVCILEAMKVFNEIKAEVAGTVEKILVKNQDAVEYGQPLFLVRPA